MKIGDASFRAMLAERGSRFINTWWLAVILSLLCSLPLLAVEKEDYLVDAQKYYGGGEFRAAIIQLKNALLIDPDDGAARLLLGMSYLQLGEGLPAEKELQRARELGVSREAVLEPWGRALLMTGQNSELLRAVAHEAGDSPALKIDILLLQGQAYVADQHFAMAEEKFSQALELDPAETEAMIGLARLMYQGKDTKRSVELVNRAIATDPGMTEAWVLKGIQLRHSGKHEEAAAAVQKALAISPSNVPARLEKATILLAQGKTNMAMAEIEQIQSKRPGLYPVVYVKALAHYQQQQLTQAQESVQFILQQQPSHMPSILLAGAIAYHLGQLNQAEDYLNTYWMREPGNRQATVLLAATRLKLDQPDKAIEVLEPGLQAAAADAQYLAMMGSACLAAGKTDRGIEYLEKAVELSPDAAALHVQLALGRMTAGDVDRAVGELQTAVDLGQNEVQADVLLVIAHLYNRDFDSALAGAQTLKETMPASPVPDNLAGTALFSLDRPAAARAAFEDSLRLQPDFLPAHFNLAQIDVHDGNTAEAAERYRKILGYEEGNLKALLALADLARRSNSVTETEQWLKQARSYHPEAIEPALRLVEHYQRNGDLPRAMQVARETATSHPKTPAVLMALGHIQLAAREYQDARNTLRSLVELAPDAPDAHYLLAMVELKLGNYAAGRDSLEKALELRVDFPAAQMMLGRQDIRDRDYDSAFAIAANLLEAHPDAAYGDELKGDVHTARGDHGLAADAYTAAYDRAGSALLARRIYQSRLQSSETRPAYAALARWLEDHPGDIAIRSTLASALLRAGQHQESINQYLKVLEYSPDNVMALNNIAWLYQERNEPSAVSYAERAYALAPDRPDVMDTLGWLLVHNGATNRGLVLLQEARVKAPHIPEIHYHMAVALHKAGRAGEARKELDRLLKGGKDFPGRDEAEALRNQLGG